MKPEPDKLFSVPTILLVPFGILLNILFAQLVLYWQLPLFLDSIGTIYVAAVGGLLPGIMVGFFSNAINAIGDPITLYYSVISVLIALLAVLFSKKGLLRRFFPSLATALPYAVIGGILGSLLTWALSGLSVGTGVSSPYALSLIAQFGLSPFIAQLSADFVIDLIDKLVTVILVFVLLKCTPQKLLQRFPHGSIYLPADPASPNEPQ